MDSLTKPTSPWTQNLTDELVRLWNDGISISAIALELGMSKGAVVGKAHRLGLNRHPQQARSWTDEETELLKTMWLSGVSSGAIERALGVSDSAVKTKVRALGLPLQREISHKKVRKRAAAPRVKLVHIPPANDPEIPLHQRKTLLELTSKTCRWPVGDPGVDLFFCGADPIEGKPYCACHCAIAYQPRQPKKLSDKHATFLDGQYSRRAA